MSQIAFVKDRSWVADALKEIGRDETKKAKDKSSRKTAQKIIILDKKADFLESQYIAEQNRGRLATLKDFILGLKSDPTLIERAKGHWFWLGDHPGLKIGEYFKLDYKNGSIAEVSIKEWYELPIEKRALVDKISSGYFFIFLNKNGPIISLNMRTLARYTFNRAPGVAYVSLDESTSRGVKDATKLIENRTKKLEELNKSKGSDLKVRLLLSLEIAYAYERLDKKLDSQKFYGKAAAYCREMAQKRHSMGKLKAAFKYYIKADMEKEADEVQKEILSRKTARR